MVETHQVRRLIPAVALAGAMAIGLMAPDPALAAGAESSSLDRLVDRLVGLVLPPSPTEALDAVSSKANLFWSLVADCGYRVSEVITESGIPPRVAVRLVRTVELAEEDRTWIGERLDDWAEADRSLTATLSRRVVVALLEASEDPRFQSVAIDIAMAPVPTATFRLVPRSETSSAGTLHGH